MENIGSREIRSKNYLLYKNGTDSGSSNRISKNSSWIDLQLWEYILQTYYLGLGIRNLKVVRTAVPTVTPPHFHRRPTIPPPNFSTHNAVFPRPHPQRSIPKTNRKASIPPPAAPTLTHPALLKLQHQQGSGLTGRKINFAAPTTTASLVGSCRRKDRKLRAPTLPRDDDVAGAADKTLFCIYIL